MKNRVKTFEQALTVDVPVASNGTPVVGGRFVLTPQGFGSVAASNIAAGDVGVGLTAGLFRLPKATGAGSGAALGPIGANVYWDSGNNRLTGTRPAGAIRYVMTLEAAATDADTEAVVRLYPPNAGQMFTVTATGTAVSPGLTIDTGLGKVPTAVFVTSVATDGTWRVVADRDLLTGVDAGKVTITTAAGASSDVHTLLVIP